jgi:hypothetical protein
MKTNLFTYALIPIIAITISSCSKSSIMGPSNSNATVAFTSSLSGANETPANGSAATGTASFSYNTTTYILSGTVNFSGISATDAHIHKGAVGVAGGVVFPLGSSTITSPISFTSAPLDATQRADLLANLYYVNIHSTSFPNGEIRGQLISSASASSTSNGSGGVSNGGY